MPRIAYHITDSANAEAILANGLHADIGERSAELGETIPGVYLFPDNDYLIDALGNWLGEMFEEVAELTVFEVDVEGYVDHSDVGFEIVVHDDIPAERIRFLRTEA